MASNTDISILIVNWNTRERTLACVESVRRYSADSEKVQIIVVDNDSADDSVAAFRQAWDDVDVIENSENMGFGRANNEGLKLAGGRIILFLNSDTEVTETTIENLVAEFDAHPEIAAFGCRILGYDEAPQHSVRGFPTPGAYLYSDTPFGLFGLFRASHERYRRKQFDFERWQPIEVAMGAALAVRREVLDRLDGFDPQFFMYFEEADLCRRIHDAGYGLAYTPAPVVYHVGGESSRKDKAKMMLALRRSMFQYFRKHEPAWKMRLFAVAFKPLFLLHTVLTYLKLGIRSRMGWGRQDKDQRRQKYRRRLEVTRDFLVRHSLEFLRS
jgi:GT2 family glycosyltransferase